MMSETERPTFGDRTSAMPSRYHAMAFGFRYDKEHRLLRPVTRDLTVFEHGVDDVSVEYPWRSAGYSTKGVGSNDACFAVTNTYRGGALYNGTESVMLTRVTLDPAQSLRLLAPEFVTYYNSGNVDRVARDPSEGSVPLFTRDGGTSRGSAGVSDAWESIAHAGIVRIRPPGHNIPFSALLGTMRDFRTKTGFSIVPGTQVFIDTWTSPNANGDRDRLDHPNRIDFLFGDSVRPVSADLPMNDGDYAVLDIDVRVTFARVKFSHHYDGIDESDVSKIAAWQAEVARPASK